MNEASRRPATGKVYLVGAGPDDPKLLTLRAVEVLGACDVVLVDHLVNRDVLTHLKRGAEVIDVGKRAGDHAVKQVEICALLVAHARRGRVVVRLKGGDPFVFGRGGEEALALVEAGVPWEVVPGVSAGVAAAAYAGIPLTHRGVASRVSFRTAHHREHAEDDRSGDDETLVFFMCGSTLAHVARELVAGGRSPSTPVAVVQSGTNADQEVFIGTLADAIDGPTPIASPALAIVGDVVTLEGRLRWFEGRTSRPLQDSAQSHSGSPAFERSAASAARGLRRRPPGAEARSRSRPAPVESPLYGRTPPGSGALGLRASQRRGASPRSGAAPADAGRAPPGGTTLMGRGASQKSRS